MTDINRVRGDTYSDEFQVMSLETGLALNISGASFLMTVSTDRLPQDSTDNLYQLSGVISDAVNGIVSFAPTSTQADRIGIYYFDVQMTLSTGVVRTIDKGRYRFTQDISK